MKSKTVGAHELACVAIAEDLAMSVPGYRYPDGVTRCVHCAALSYVEGCGFEGARALSADGSCNPEEHRVQCVFRRAVELRRSQRNREAAIPLPGKRTRRAK